MHVALFYLVFLCRTMFSQEQAGPQPEPSVTAFSCYFLMHEKKDFKL